MTTFTRALAVAATGLMAATLASPVLAAENPAESRMLTKTDVPSSLGKPTSTDFDAKVIDKVIGICDNATGTTLVSVPAPALQFLVDIETKNKKTYTEVMERVYQFATPAAATAAFAELSDKLSTCNGTTTMTSSTPNLTQTVTTGSYPGGEFEDFWINVKGTWTGGELKKPSRTALRAIYVQAGDAIVETVAYINGKGQLTGRQGNDLADLAETLGSRWVG